MRRRLLLLLCVVLLAGCGSVPGGESATPVRSPTAVPLSGLPARPPGGRTPQAAAPPTARAAGARSTVTPTWASTARPAPTFVPALPDPASLRWETVPASSGGLRRLAGLTTAVLRADPSPDGRHWVVVLMGSESLGQGWQRVGLYVLDGEDDRHWLAAAEGLSELDQYAWLPDGRLLWVDGGRLFVADASGRNRVDLEAPEAVAEVWVGGEGRALVRGDSAFWRLDLGTRTWEQMTATGGESLLSDGAPRAGIAPDGGFATVLGDAGEVWRLPLSAGEPAVQVGTIDVVGSDAGRLPPPISLAKSPYWVFPEHPGTSLVGGQLSDSRDGRLAPVEGFFPQARGSGLPVAAPIRSLGGRSSGGGASSRFSVSPDGEWLAVAPVRSAPDAPLDPPGGLYIAPSHDLSAGRFFGEASLVGWQRDPAATLLEFPEGPELVRVILPGGEPATVLDKRRPLAWRGGTLTSDPLFVVQLDGERLRLLAFDRDAQPLATLEPPISVETAPFPYGAVDLPTFSIAGAAHPSHLLFTTLTAEGPSLWLWTVTP